VCVILSNWLVSSPIGILLQEYQSLTRNSTLGVSSLWFYWVGELGQWGQPVSILCVCVCLWFVCRVHRVLRVHPPPRHKSRESVKIGPHPRGQPQSYGISSLWLPQIYSCVVISTINFENPKNSPKIASKLISGFVKFFVVLIHRFDVLGVDLHCHKFSSPGSSYFFWNRWFFLSISAQVDEHLEHDFSKKSEPKKAGPQIG
jgi:hypothetical protein